MTDDLQTELDAYRQKLTVDHYDVTVRELVRMAVDGELHITPEYQRKFRWEEEKESRLVESLFLELPVPPLFVASNKTGTWELVDGLQRVSTLVHFVADPPESVKIIGKREPLRLTDLEKLSKWSGRTFADLPTPLQLYFLKRPIRVTVLSDKSDLEVRFDLFERLNTGGVKLTHQEVRACIYHGEFAKLLETLAEDPNFNSLLKLQQGKQQDGTQEELVLKFFAYLHNREQFRDNVKAFLNDYMETYGPQLDVAGSTRLFQEVCRELVAVIDVPLARKGLTPINQFEAVMVAAAELLLAGETPTRPPEGWLEDPEFLENSTNGTNSRKKLNGRINRARALLKADTSPITQSNG